MEFFIFKSIGCVLLRRYKGIYTPKLTKQEIECRRQDEPCVAESKIESQDGFLERSQHSKVAAAATQPRHSQDAMDNTSN